MASLGKLQLGFGPPRPAPAVQNADRCLASRRFPIDASTFGGSERNLSGGAK